MKAPKRITLRRQGEGFYSVHRDGERLHTLSVWDRRWSTKRARGWLLRNHGPTFLAGSRTVEKLFSTLAELREYCQTQFGGGR